MVTNYEFGMCIAARIEAVAHIPTLWAGEDYKRKACLPPK